MELNEVFRRVVLRHKRLIAFCVVVGVAVPVALDLTAEPTYTASTRLVLNSGDPSSPEASAAIADGAKAIVTSPDHVADAFAEIGYDGGDPLAYSREHVSVRALGTSSVLELEITDDDPQIASDMANALAADLIRTRERTGGQAQKVIDDLTEEVDDLGARIDTLQEQFDDLDAEIATARSLGNDTTALEMEQLGVQNKRDELASTRLDVQAQLRDVQIQVGLNPRPTVIDPAAPPPAADAKNVVTDGALGGLLGLLVGLGIASAREMLHPTVAGGDAIARAFGTRPLGTVRRVRGRWAPLKEDDPVVVRLRLAAQSARAETVEVVAVPAGLDPAAFAYRLQDAIPGAARRGHPQGGLVVRAFGSEVNPDASSHPVALVLSERAVTLRDVESLRDLLALAERPVIGVIVAEGRRRGKQDGDDPTPRTKVIELPTSEVVRPDESELASALFESAPAPPAPRAGTFEKPAPASNADAGAGERTSSRSRGARKRAARRAANASNGASGRTQNDATPSAEPTPATVSSTAAAGAAAAVGGRPSAAVTKSVASNGASSTNGKAIGADDAGVESGTAPGTESSADAGPTDRSGEERGV